MRMLQLASAEGSDSSSISSSDIDGKKTTILSRKRNINSVQNTSMINIEEKDRIRRSKKTDNSILETMKFAGANGGNDPLIRKKKSSSTILAIASSVVVKTANMKREKVGVASKKSPQSVSIEGLRRSERLR